MTAAVLRHAGLGLASLAVCAVSVSAQVKPTPEKTAPAKPMEMDHSHMMDKKEPATGWKELDAFHELMAGSWHPAKDKSDLAPAKAKAADMAKAAKSWADSKAPKGCDSPTIKDALVKVNAGSQEFAALVVKGTGDLALKTKLGSIHETFEVIEMGCKPEKSPAK